MASGVHAATSLTSSSSREILDLVDSLSSYGINEYLDLPQIIVCGDQSSGKSSVLEAISRVPFAVQDGLCTRFATEIILRRQEVKDFKASIINSASRQSDNDNDEASNSEEQARPKFTPPEGSSIEVIFEAAKEYMGLSEDQDKTKSSFSNDVLRIEISGPDQPHLTLVDLPGLFEAATTTQSAADAQMVKDMVISYMKKPRSIILAVVSAANEFPLQQVTQRTREIDPNGMRTLGLITKPDKLERDCNTEKFYLTLAKNKEVQLSLGWHVLRNRSYQQKGANSASRDQQESDFFAHAPWNSLPPSQLGVEALKSRLSDVLYNHILEHIPAVMKEIKSGINDCKGRLGYLEQRAHLIDVSQRFANLMRDAVRGDYSDDFFMLGEEMQQSGRLRATIRNNISKFSKNMHSEGCSQKIIADDETSEGIKRSEYVAQVQEMLKEHRGCELPGTFSPMIVGELFKRQIVPWQDIVHEAVLSTVNDVRISTSAILKHVAGKDVAKHIRLTITTVAIDELQDDLTDTAQQLLVPLQKFHPMTQNHYLTENVQREQAKRRKVDVADRLTAFLGKDKVVSGIYKGMFEVDKLVDSILGVSNLEMTEPNMDKYAAGLATDMMEAYYKVALKKFVDDFEVNAVEVCLMQKLPNIFSPTVVSGLPDDTVSKIAGESQEKIQERHKLREKMAALGKGEELLRRVCP
ncbi:P-loop containing nucleoside triphosphate hydrolase protein [Apiospora arundinis]|uniref:P-loop containing nucleoside triphosphate hydrolase protein n=1 Tax=Apiospora arundinis TaxID=335852 RepID=A0ABR2HSP7_9PEZI